MDSKHIKVFIWDFLYHPQNGTWTISTNQQKKSSFKIYSLFILDLVAQRPKVLARQEATAVCILIEIIEATWCLVWEGGNISAGRSPSIMFIRSFCSVSE